MLNNINPFFILGNPRSGTTLLRLMLDSHPLITVPPECGFLVWFYNKYKNWEIQQNKNNIDLFINDLKTAKKIDSWKLNYKALTDFLYQQNPDSYANLGQLVYLFYSIQLEKKITYWGDKNNFYLNYIPLLKELYPKARFIHIIRDGRDVAVSYKELNGATIKSEYAPKLSNNIETIANEWNSNNEKILTDLEANIDNNKYTTITFESLVLESESTLKLICKFLEIPFNSQMLTYYTQSKTYEPDEFLHWKAKTKHAPQKDRIKRFKHDLPAKEQEIFTQIAGSMLSKFGYEQ